MSKHTNATRYGSLNLLREQQRVTTGADDERVAAASILASFYGNRTNFVLTSAGMTGVLRTFTSFASAVRQVIDARVWGGIHFRTAGVVAADMGTNIARYILVTALRPKQCGRG